MAAKSPGPMLWTPRLHPFAEDEEVWLQEPFKTSFTSRNTRISTRHQIDTSWERLTTQLLQAPDWAEWAWDWLAYCIREDVTSKIPEHLLSQALELILNVDIPAEYNWFDDLDQRDNRESDWEDVDSDSDSGSNYSSDVQMPPVIDDDEPMPGSEVEEEYSSDAYMPDFTQFSATPAPCALPMKKPKFSGDCTELPAQWFQHMQVFFYPKVAPDLRRTQKDVVNGLVNMRLLPKKFWNTPVFQMALEMSGLLDKMYEISEPGNLLETSHTDVLESFRFHNWKSSYPELICKWTPATISLEDYEAQRAKPDPNYSFDKDDAEELLCFIFSHPRMHPWAFNPMAVFLLSLDCFKFYSEIWLAPSLHTLRYPRIQGWDPAKVYRTIMRLPLLADTKTPTLRSFLLNLTDRKLSVVIREMSAHRSLLLNIKQQLWQSDTTSENPSASKADAVLDDNLSDLSDLSAAESSGGEARRNNNKANKRSKKKKAEQAIKRAQQVEILTPRMPPNEQHCPQCADEEMDNQCVRQIQVFERKDAASLIGAALTCASEWDRLKPLPAPTKQKKSQTKTTTEITETAVALQDVKVRYENPETLGMRWIKPCDHVYSRCGQDITRFYFVHEDDTLEWVGGVHYNAMHRDILEYMIDNHR
ncbi:hypothetical protein B0H17DRAFT_1190694 [Mycena rosella]|uniref:Uncharacterized protein n=1 Tax=Mycena rosella TaxID=1033263 RepID=A0AAD7MBY0_MYCRO|nr:hypothetical protein B0H17DRAFT_1190694 [Mycena rosella]